MAALTPNDYSSDPAAALQKAQQAPLILSKASSVSTNFPASIFSSADSIELWNDLEQLLYACLRTGDDKSAFLCVEKLTERFGPTNERVMALKGLYQEAVASDMTAIKKILEDYNKILMENPMNVPVLKRRIALIRSIGRPQEAITDLVEFVDSFPTDMEAWCELSDLYQTQGCSSQAIFCLEEALLITPNAWNLHARLGELEYMAGVSAPDSPEGRDHLSLAVKRFSRSIELCDGYLRGFYGLKLVADKLLQTSTTSRAQGSTDLTPEKLQKLSQLATSKLEAIVRDRTTRRSPGVNESELAAAKDLLSKSKS
ncbi:Inositol phosphatase SIW14 [Rhinocladiella similis]